MKVLLQGGPAHGKVFNVPESTHRLVVPKLPLGMPAAAVREEGVLGGSLAAEEVTYSRTGETTEDGMPIYRCPTKSPAEWLQEVVGGGTWIKDPSHFRWFSEEYPHIFISEFALVEARIFGRTPVMFCGYCHGKHEEWSEVLRCAEEAKRLDLEDQFWTPTTVVGYRGFSVVSPKKGVFKLRGVKTVWETAEPGRAQCIPADPFMDPRKKREPHEAPMTACMCGYYAFKDYADADIWHVDAKVELWGDIIEHEKGYRGEYARLLAIREGRGGSSSAIGRMPGIVEEIADQYGVEYEWLKSENQ